MNMSEAKKVLVRNVRRGAKLLDGLCPDWYKLININILDLSNARNCIVGQLGLGYCLNHTDFNNGFALPYREYYSFPESHRMLGKLNDRGWNYLTNLWIRQILKRRRLA